MSREMRSGHSCYPMREISDNVTPPWLYIFFNHFLFKEVSTVNRNEVHTPLSGFCSVVVQRHLITSIHSVYKEQVPPVSTSRIGSQDYLAFSTLRIQPPRLSPDVGPRVHTDSCTNLQKNLPNCSENNCVHSSHFWGSIFLEKELKAWVPLKFLLHRNVNFQGMKTWEMKSLWNPDTRIQQTLDWTPWIAVRTLRAHSFVSADHSAAPSAA